MRFIHHDDYHGEQRIIKKFLWFPKTLRNPDTRLLETRWLEFARISQQYVTVHTIGCELGWNDLCWTPPRTSG